MNWHVPTPILKGGLLPSQLPTTAHEVVVEGRAVIWGDAVFSPHTTIHCPDGSGLEVRGGLKVGKFYGEGDGPLGKYGKIAPSLQVWPRGDNPNFFNNLGIYHDYSDSDKWWKTRHRDYLPEKVEKNVVTIRWQNDRRSKDLKFDSHSTVFELWSEADGVVKVNVPEFVRVAEVGSSTHTIELHFRHELDESLEYRWFVHDRSAMVDVQIGTLKGVGCTRSVASIYGAQGHIAMLHATGGSRDVPTFEYCQDLHVRLGDVDNGHEEYGNNYRAAVIGRARNVAVVESGDFGALVSARGVQWLPKGAPQFLGSSPSVYADADKPLHFASP